MFKASVDPSVTQSDSQFVLCFVDLQTTVDVDDVNQINPTIILYHNQINKKAHQFGEAVRSVTLDDGNSTWTQFSWQMNKNVS